MLVGSRARPAHAGPDRLVSRVRGRAGEIVLALLFLVVATVLQVTRQPLFTSTDTMWQEDGRIFLQGALSDGFLDTLVQSYNSYLHVVPRAIAEVVALFPLDNAARLLTIFAAVVVSLLTLYVYYASAAVFRTHWARAAVAGSMLVLPATAYETNVSPANLHWYLSYAAFWAVIRNPRGPGGVALAATIVGLAVLSDPFTGIFLPLALFLAWRDRSQRIAWVVPVVFTVTMAVQLGFGLFTEPAGRYAPSEWDDLPGVYGLRVAGSLLVGDEPLAGLFKRPGGWYFVYGSLALVLALVVYAYRRGDRAWKAFVAQCFAYSVLYLAVPCMLRGTEGFLIREGFTLNGSRYTVVPILFLVAIVVGVLERGDRRMSPARWRKLQYAVAIWATFLVLNNYAITTVRSSGPSWRYNLEKARDKCEGRLPDEGTDWVSGPSYPGPDEPVAIHISPNVHGWPWRVYATCRKVEEGQSAAESRRIRTSATPTSIPNG